MAANQLLSRRVGTPVVLGKAKAISLPNATFASRQPRRRIVTVAAASRKDDEAPAESSTAILLSLSLTVAAAPAFAAASSAVVQKAPSATSILSSPPPISIPTDAVDSAVSQVTDAVKAAGGAVKSGLGVAAKGAGYVKEAVDVATPYVRRGSDIVIPYVKATVNVVGEVAKPVIRATGPIVQSGVNEVEQFLARQGLNPGAIVDSTRGVTSKAEDAINYASPTVRSTAGALSTKSPQLLAEYALGLVALYYLGPPVLKGVFGSFRGYAGQISPASALDAAANDGNAIIVDIRTSNEKEYAGIPDIPNSNRLVELEFATVSNRRVRGQLRNAGQIERQMTVLQIAALKKVKKGSRVLLLDKNGGVSKDIAKALTKRGYRKVFVITGGFNSWTASKLQTKGSSSVSAVEVLGPLFGTRSTGRSDRTQKGQRYLPSGR